MICARRHHGHLSTPIIFGDEQPAIARNIPQCQLVGTWEYETFLTCKCYGINFGGSTNARSREPHLFAVWIPRRSFQGNPPGSQHLLFPISINDHNIPAIAREWMIQEGNLLAVR